MKYRVLVILEECDPDNEPECEENVDFAEFLDIFDTIEEAGALIRKVANDNE